MRLLDLFCGAGGAAMGYSRAGFTEIVGVDSAPQKHYPFAFVQADALEYFAAHGKEFDLIHASPPCQAYSVTRFSHNHRDQHPKYITAVRQACKGMKQPYVIENVRGAPIKGIMLCGTMFGLLVIRHRIFELSWGLPLCQPCQHERKVVQQGKKPNHLTEYHCVVGNFSDVGFAREAMGIAWMNQKELSQAIPPAYTEFIGESFLKSQPAPGHVIPLRKAA